MQGDVHAVHGKPAALRDPPGVCAEMRLMYQAEHGPGIRLHAGLGKAYGGQAQAWTQLQHQGGRDRALSAQQLRQG